MPWTADTFIATYSEFAEERRTVVASKLAEAARRVSTTVWGAMADDGVALLTAHLLALIPYSSGSAEAPVKPVVRADGRTSYFDEFKRLERIVGSANRIIPHEEEDDTTA